MSSGQTAHPSTPARRLRNSLLKAAYLLTGVALLAVVAAEMDFDAVWRQIDGFGMLGLLVILALYAAAFTVDSVTWTMALTTVALDARWIARMWWVRLAGEAFNNLLPAAGLGGEPFKAVVLKTRWGVPYRDATASLVLARTINLVSLCVFMAAGFAFMLQVPGLPDGAGLVASAGLAAACLATFAFIGVQRWKLSSRTAGWIHGLPGGERVGRVLDAVHDFDERLADFYVTHTRRFWAAVALALINWLLGVAEIYYAMAFLGAPVSWLEAYVIEAFTQMVRLGTFFIPLSLGAQEGAFVMLVGAMSGSAPLGFALAMVKRAREFIWIALGLLAALVSQMGRTRKP